MQNRQDLHEFKAYSRGFKADYPKHKKKKKKKTNLKLNEVFSFYDRIQNGHKIVSRHGFNCGNYYISRPFKKGKWAKKMLNRRHKPETLQ